MPTVYDPIWIGKVKLKNRFVLAPTVKNFANEDGTVNTRYLQQYELEAQGPGLVTVTMSFVEPSGKVFTRQLGAHHDNCIPGLADLAERIHRAGAKCALQISHGGNLCSESIIGETPVGPSERPQWPGQKVRALKTDEVEKIIESYAKAAWRAKVAGFDAVDLHACHGSMILQFLSPFHNKGRTDKYAVRTTFLYETVQAVQDACGVDFPIIVRISAHEFMEEDMGEPGLTIDEVANEIAPQLERLGVACIHVSAGRIGHTEDHCFPPLYEPRGVNVRLATKVKEKVNIPVITVGRLQDPKIIEKIIEDGKADMVAMCRPIIADPHLPKKMIEGRIEDIRQCMGCNYCLHRLFLQLGVQCPMNPEYSWEYEYQPTPAKQSKKVMVVGGGVAGLQTAYTAAQRGHQVTIYEKTNQLGGQVRLASSIPRLYTKELWNLPKWLIRQVEKLGVNIELGKEVTPELVEQVNPDVVVVATGAQEIRLELPGHDNEKVVYLWDYLEGKASVGDKVVVIGGNEGAEVAVSLAREGKTVTLVEETENIGCAKYIYDGAARRKPLLRFLRQANVRILTKTQVKEINSQGVKVLQSWPMPKEEIIEADTVMIAVGRKSEDSLYRALQGKGFEIYQIGDCVEPRSMVSATHEGNWVGRHI
ncbi:FAD-dependent oxidoreductase [Calderihabitans maritimus]|uniref:NADH:flavin oxidoreductase n=1 Tax=Calderihabitans maritimus TaxID=1246530 RepID=A0A1Z5HW54_9FIRM|nr:FAD-dependent oxidoreductase [Calderihabitans maritimus]GAW93545.1 NADH:flavin oxidoreductase [Calderihabitans maritimus]